MTKSGSLAPGSTKLHRTEKTVREIPRELVFTILAAITESIWDVPMANLGLIGAKVVFFEALFRRSWIMDS